LMRLNKNVEQRANNGIFVPWSDDSGQYLAIAELRQQGKKVVMGLPGQSESAEEMGCNSVLTEKDGEWVVSAI
jgi:ATP phosphoribosyltransferase regulatory subunit